MGLIKKKGRGWRMVYGWCGVEVAGCELRTCKVCIYVCVYDIVDGKREDTDTDNVGKMCIGA